VLAGDEAGAQAALAEALACAPAGWMLATTADTLEMLGRGQVAGWVPAITAALRGHIAA
jgi:hypothetical protein